LLWGEGFVNQHDRDAIANRVVSLAFLAHQVIAFTLDGLFVERARQDGQ
jgi:hypothetical protein